MNGGRIVLETMVPYYYPFYPTYKDNFLKLIPLKNNRCSYR